MADTIKYMTTIAVTPKYACPRCLGVRYGLVKLAGTQELIETSGHPFGPSNQAVVMCELCRHGWREANIKDGMFEVSSPVHDSQCPADCDTRKYPVVDPDRSIAPYGAVEIGPGHFLAFTSSGRATGPEFGNGLNVPRRPHLRGR